MKRDGVKVFFAVAFGIGIGVITGRSIDAGFGWIIGALCGGIVGYLAVAPIEALRAIPRAWIAMRPSAGEWENIRWRTWAVVAPFTAGLAVVLPIAWADPNPKYMTTLSGFAIVGLCAMLIGFFVWVFAYALADAAIPPRRPIQFIATHTLLPVFVCWDIPRLLWWCARRTPSVAQFFGRLGLAWLRLVHSNLRLLCLTDAFLFAGIGTILGGPVVAWMVIGGVFGVLNYEIISVQFFGQHPVLVRRR